MARQGSRRWAIVRWFFLFAFPLAAIFAIYGTASVLSGQITDRQTTRGTVVSIASGSAGRGVTCTEEYTYIVNGVTYHGKSSPHCTGTVGGTITVHYNSHDPHSSHIDPLWYSIFIDVCLVVLTLVLIAFTIGMWAYQRALRRSPGIPMHR